MSRGEESRIQANNSLVGLVDRLGVLTDQMRTQQQLMTQLAETQGEVRPLLTRLTELDLPMEIAARGPRYVLVRKPQ